MNNIEPIRRYNITMSDLSILLEFVSIRMYHRLNTSQYVKIHLPLPYRKTLNWQWENLAGEILFV